MTGGTTSEPWFVTAFRREYLEVYAHRDGEDARRAVAFCREAFGERFRGPLLDLCCGAGRHLKLFEAAGIDCTGIDLSADLLDRARAEGVRAALIQADARELPLPDGTFAGLVNLFSSFGYFDDEASHMAMLREARRVLLPGSLAVFDLMNPGWVSRNLRPETVESRNGFSIHARRRITPAGPRVEKHVRVTRESSGELVTEYTESVRMFDASEFGRMLGATNFETVSKHGDFDGSAYHHTSSPRQITVARAV